MIQKIQDYNTVLHHTKCKKQNVFYHIAVPLSDSHGTSQHFITVTKTSRSDHLLLISIRQHKSLYLGMVRFVSAFFVTIVRSRVTILQLCVKLNTQIPININIHPQTVAEFNYASSFLTMMFYSFTVNWKFLYRSYIFSTVQKPPAIPRYNLLRKNIM